MFSPQFTILHTLGKEMETLNEIYEAYQVIDQAFDTWFIALFRPTLILRNVGKR